MNKRGNKKKIKEIVNGRTVVIQIRAVEAENFGQAKFVRWSAENLATD